VKDILLKSKGNLTLRRLQDEDKTALATLANNKMIWDHIRDVMPYPYTHSDAEFFISLTKKEVPAVTFAITVENDFCGVIGLIPKNDVYRLSAEMGYWIGEPYWGQGLATEAVNLMVNYAFDQLNLERVEAGVFEFNPASMRVLEKNGFVREGISRRAVYKNGRFCDEHKFARLKNH